jgi:hypothetical protein
MDYYIYNIDEYSKDPRQGNKFAPECPFRMGVSGSSDTGKTNMLMNLFMGTKKLKEGGERYIRCNDILLIGKHLNEPKWNIIKNFFDELAKEGEDVSFKALPPSEIPELEEFDPSRTTVVIFEDLMNETKKIQERIADYFSNGRHRNISAIYVSQRFFLIPKTIRENITYISLHRGGGSLADIKRIISLYTERSNSIASIIDDLTRKKEFIVFDLRRPRDDPLSIRVRWDTSLSSFLDGSSMISDGLKPILDGGNPSSIILNDSSTILDNIIDDSNTISDNSNTILDQSKFSLYGQKLIKNAKRDGTLLDLARNMPSPADRKKILAKGVHVKNSTIWAKYIYREAFNIKDKDLGPDWIKFAASMKQ